MQKKWIAVMSSFLISSAAVFAIVNKINIGAQELPEELKKAN